MRSALSNGAAVVSLISNPLLSPAAAAHLHSHGKIVRHLDHVQQARAVSSSGTYDKTSSDCSMHLSAIEHTTSKCFRGHCGATTQFSVDAASNQPPNVWEIHIKTLQQSNSETAATPTRQRPQKRPFESTEIITPTQSASHESWVHELDLSLDTAEHPLPDDTFRDTSVNESDDVEHPHLELRAATVPLRILHPRQAGAYESFALGDSPQPSSTISAVAAGTSDLCPQANGTTFKSRSGISYQVLCNIDFPGNDFPFQKTGSLEECILRCDTMNWLQHGVFCLAGVFVPSRVDYDNDCYLKSSIDDPSYTSLDIHALVRLSAIKSLTSEAAQSTASTQSTSSVSSVAVSPSKRSSQAADPSSSGPGPAFSTPPKGNEPGVTYAAGEHVIEPEVAGSHLHGPSKNTPSKQYLNIDSADPIKLADNLLMKTPSDALTSDYDMAPQTGVLSVNISTQASLSPIEGTPHLSRDGGGGGYLNGQHLFVFCDTGSYTAPTAGKDGKFLGFVASSVAVDDGMHGLNNEPLNLKDGVGQWWGPAGRERGFAPLTEGELAYNLKMQGGGQRYAIWPEAPLLPLDANRAIIIAPIVFDDVDMQTRKAKFTYTGATLLTITADNKAGPIAERTVAKLFNQNEIEWGCSGGIRSWGPSGVGGMDGYVYIFGNIHGGIVLARTTPKNVGDRNSYEFWHGDSWTKQMLTADTDAFFLKGIYNDINVFYSPRHLTFIIVYLTSYADNTFHFRYLKADNAVRPHFAPGGDGSSDYVENIYKYQWSDEKFLYKAPPSLSGRYIYAGAVHAGYYGSTDITNGGTRMLLSWTAPTGEDPASTNSEYQIVTAGIDWE